ncbi:MAG TPA: YwqJ-related putative deaminase [Kutzneria sp.]
MSGFETDPDHLRRSGGMLSKFGQTVGKAGEKLEDTGQNLVEHAAGDRSGVGSVVAKFSGRAMSILGKVFQQGGRVADKAGQNLHKTGDLHEGADHEAKNLIERQHPDNKSKHLPGEGTRTASAVSGGGKRSDPKKLPGSDEHKPEEVGEGSGGKKDKTPPKVDGEDHRSGDLFERRKPPSATEPVEHPPTLPTSHSPGKDGPDGEDTGIPHTTDTGPADKRRGAVLEEIDPKGDRVTTKNGLIDTIDGKPVKQYMDEVSEKRAHEISAGMHKKDGPCSAAAIDLRTGMITEGVNGRPNSLIPQDNLHPTLQDNLKNMGDWKHDVVGKDGTVLTTFDGKAHHDQPLRHAEVKAVNELLWERERRGMETGPSALDELRIDPRFLKDGTHMKVGGEAGACANCYNILDGVPSYTGRFPYHPDDHRYSRVDVADR